jgi:hypothetical protein
VARRTRPINRQLSTRCLVCWKRRILALYPAEYQDGRIPKCTGCKQQRYCIVKQYRGPVCSCPGYMFPHRMGCKFCYENPKHELHVRMRDGESKADIVRDIASRSNETLTPVVKLCDDEPLDF